MNTLAPGTLSELESRISQLTGRYQRVRHQTESLCEPLKTEDYVVQSMPDVSPTKWHLAHTSWFFETFLLAAHAADYRCFHPEYAYLFNSYYVSVGERFSRPSRGLLSRPTVGEILEYRRYVDEQMLDWMSQFDANSFAQLMPLIELGINHEQQHQELMLTDIKHVFGINPQHPAYCQPSPAARHKPPAAQWVLFDETIDWIGHGEVSFAYDNELPRHRLLIGPFKLASRLVTNGEFRSFIEDGGYDRATLWLSDGWAVREQEQWKAPLYWKMEDEQWWHYTLGGFRPVEDSEPVCHVSYFEADAYARWAGARLPTEFEWEIASQAVPIEGNFVESRSYHPIPLPASEPSVSLHQMFGDVWEWTRSQYEPYPGYVPAPGAVGEYNGKFMCNQFVLRGGSCATPQSHIRRTYRNFFPPGARWQFTGIRLASDV